jgi:hypothetical protein
LLLHVIYVLLLGIFAMAAIRKQNITLTIERDILMRARGVAARRGCSVSALLAGELQRLVASEQEYEVAMRRARAMMSTGLSLGGAKLVDRDAIHERRRLR